MSKRQASDVYFDNNTTSVVDEWLEGTKASNPSVPEIDASRGKNKRSGIGFNGKKSNPNEINILENRIKNQKQKQEKKAKLDANDDDDDNDGFHGIIEEEFSKLTSIKSKKPMTKPSQQSVKASSTTDKSKKAPKAAPNSDKEVTENPKKKFKNLEAMSGFESNKTGNNNTAKPRNNKNSAAAVEGEGEVDGDGGGEGSEEKHKRVRQRKKTRSKQKNIRKDNRPDEEKPTYLRLGADNYRGWDLSEATLTVLNKKSTVPSSDSS